MPQLTPVIAKRIVDEVIKDLFEQFAPGKWEEQPTLEKQVLISIEMIIDQVICGTEPKKLFDEPTRKIKEAELANLSCGHQDF